MGFVLLALLSEFRNKMSSKFLNKSIAIQTFTVDHPKPRKSTYMTIQTYDPNRFSEGFLNTKPNLENKFRHTASALKNIAMKVLYMKHSFRT